MKLISSVIVALLFLACLGEYSVICQGGNQSARLFDEYGDINYEDEIARLDNLAVQLQSDPTAKGHVIIYRSRRDLPGLNYKHGFMVKNYLTRDRGISSERFVIIEGGVRSCMSVELWLVPSGATAPPLKSTYSYSLTGITATLKFDEHNYPMSDNVYEVYGTGEGIVPELLGGYAEALKKRSDARAFIIAYEQYCRENCSYGITLRDRPGTAERILKDEKGILVRHYGINPSRIVTVNGGYRRYRNVELWIVPKGADAPVPSPTVIPPRRRKR